MSEGTRTQAVGVNAYICWAESLRRQVRPLQLAVMWNQTPEKFLRIYFSPEALPFARAGGSCNSASILALQLTVRGAAARGGGCKDCSCNCASHYIPVGGREQRQKQFTVQHGILQGPQGTVLY